MAINIDLNKPDGAEKIKQIFDRRVTDLMRMATIEFFRTITISTPVDTGRARAGWTPSINVPSSYVPPEGKYGMPAIPELGTVTVRDTIYITNNLPYIKRLNNGYSRQAPARFVESAAARVQNAISVIVKNIT
jgi:hypothetical protein